MQLRTQIYLEPAQHAALLKESRRLRLSLAGMIRKLIEDHILGKGEDTPSARERKKAALSLIGLGSSGLTDISENVDAYVGQAIYEDVVGQKRAPYKMSPGKARRRGR